MGFWRVRIEAEGTLDEPHNEYVVEFARKGRGYRVALRTDADGARNVVKKLTEALNSTFDGAEEHFCNRHQKKMDYALGLYLCSECAKELHELLPDDQKKQSDDLRDELIEMRESRIVTLVEKFFYEHPFRGYSLEKIAEYLNYKPETTQKALVILLKKKVIIIDDEKKYWIDKKALAKYVKEIDGKDIAYLRDKQ